MLYPTLLAATDPQTGITNYLFTQGILGVCCVGLIIVIIYQQKKLDKKDDRINALQDARLADSTAHAVDYREMARNDQQILSGNSQAQNLLAAKIEAVKGRNSS